MKPYDEEKIMQTVAASHKVPDAMQLALETPLTLKQALVCLALGVSQRQITEIQQRLLAGIAWEAIYEDIVAGRL